MMVIPCPPLSLQLAVRVGGTALGRESTVPLHRDTNTWDACGNQPRSDRSDFKKISCCSLFAVMEFLFVLGATEKHCVVSPHHKSFSQHLVVEWWRMNFQNSIRTSQFRWINPKWGEGESFPTNCVKPQNIFVTLERPRRTRRKWQHWVRHSLANRMASEIRKAKIS